MNPMHGRTVVVTGANSGIGMATAKALARQGATVVMAGRDPAKIAVAAKAVAGYSQSEEVYPVTFNLASLQSVRQGAAQILQQFERIHVLINNAGVMLSERRVSVDGYEMTFAVNHLGHFLLTNLLLERLEVSSPSRIITVSSSGHRRVKSAPFDDLQSTKHYEGTKVYSESKLENVLFTMELARRLEGTKITANAMHPGWVATEFGRDGDTKGILGLGLRVVRPVELTPDQGARTAIFLAADPGVETVTGKYFVRCKVKEPSKAARDTYAAQHLWKVSQQLVANAAAGAPD